MLRRRPFDFGRDVPLDRQSKNLPNRPFTQDHYINFSALMQPL